MKLIIAINGFLFSILLMVSYFINYKKIIKDNTLLVWIICPIIFIIFTLSVEYIIKYLRGKEND